MRFLQVGDRIGRDLEVLSPTLQFQHSVTALATGSVDTNDILLPVELPSLVGFLLQGIEFATNTVPGGAFPAADSIVGYEIAIHTDESLASPGAAMDDPDGLVYYHTVQYLVNTVAAGDSHGVTYHTMGHPNLWYPPRAIIILDSQIRSFISNTTGLAMDAILRIFGNQVKVSNAMLIAAATQAGLAVV